ITYSLTDNAGGRFQIDGNTGVVTVLDGTLLDYESATSHTITVQAASADGSFSTQTYTINVNNVNEAPTAAITATSYTATEQTSLYLVSGGLSVGDVDGPSVTATLSVGEGVLNVTAGTTGATVTNSGTGTVTITGTQAQINAVLGGNSGATVAYFNGSDTPSASTTLTLSASDGTLSASDTATINITAVNDSTVFGGNTSGSGNEDAGTVITGTLTATDPDGAGTNPFAVTGAAANGTASINAATGAWSYTPAANFAGTDSFTVTFTDAQGFTSTQVITITVTAVATPPAAPPVSTIPPSLLPTPTAGPYPVSPVSGPASGGPPIVLVTGGGLASVLPPLASTLASNGCDTGGDSAVTPATIMAQMWMPGSCENDETAIAEAGVPDDFDRQAEVTGQVVAMAEEPPDVVMDERIAQVEEPLSSPVKKMLESGRKMAANLDRLADDLTRSMEEREQQAQLMGRVASLSGLALTAGFSAWILRGGSLLMSFLVSMPVWRHFDPVPVLGLSRRDRRKFDQQAHAAQQQEISQFRGLDRVVQSESNSMKRHEQGTGVKKDKKL
ncbi:MAG TPA: Ig-like domain-containing protein, partial [Nitrospira sp.]|nr:Ig-like domain-containing protein [Nitrospira sp.]